MTQFAIINPQNIVTAVTRPAFISLHFSRERRDRIVALHKRSKYPVKVGDKLDVYGSGTLATDHKRCWCCNYFYAPFHDLDAKCIVCEDKEHEARIDAREYEERGE